METLNSLTPAHPASGAALKPEITVVMPALNEEKNIRAAIENTINAFDDNRIRGEVIVINDGSTDRTEGIVAEMMKMDGRIGILRHETPKGIGNSFWDGVDMAASDCVVMLPGDNENDPWEIFRYLRLLEHVDMIIPFVFNKETRSFLRNALSFVYRFIVNTTFFTNFNYTNGTVLYRKSVLKDLDYRSSGFFFQTDILVRSVKKGYLFAEVPYRLGMRKGGLSKAVSFPSFYKVVKGYMRLVRDFYFVKKDKKGGSLSEDSQAAKRQYPQSKSKLI
ncbi:MAG: glycosyltransferase family 2 protein [Thermodesulfovibrionales bacterium]|nr:glycosyltransferase family 2 protein [Thermodesulfovibrionales bacterium]